VVRSYSAWPGTVEHATSEKSAYDGLGQAVGDIAFQSENFLGFPLAVVVEGQGDAEVLGGGDVAGSGLGGPVADRLPVGVQSLREHDVPYWPVANCYNYKEVWVHPSSRWLAIQRDLLALERSSVNEPPCRFSLTSRTDQRHVIIRMAAEGQGKARFVLRADNLATDQAEQETELIHGKLQKLEWSARIVDPKQPWVAVVMPHGRPAAGREIVGGYPPR
jgi:hypothetical protein